MEMSEGMDEGNILKIHTILIDPIETSETLFEKFSDISGTILIQTLRELETGGITPLPQDDNLATYCKKIEKEDGLIDWNESAKKIYQKWQAYTPWPGIYTQYEGKRLLLEKVSLLRHREDAPLRRIGSTLGVQSDPEKLKGISNSDWIASRARNDEAIGQVTKLEDGNIGIICGSGVLTLSQVKLE